jgi:hypothetical protein
MRLAQRFHAFQAMARRPPVVMKNLVLDIVERVTIAANRIGALTRGSIRTFPATVETENTASYQGGV